MDSSVPEQQRLVIPSSGEVRDVTGPLGWRRTISVVGLSGLIAGALLLAVAHPLGNTASKAVSDVVGVKEEKVCSEAGENCKSTKCCKGSGAQCYVKNKDWAMCRGECVPGLDPTDPDPDEWSCKPLGKRNPGVFYTGHLKPASWVASKCSNVSTSCLDTGCCKDPGYACYKKIDGYGQCRPACIPGPDPTDIDGHPWKCEQIGGRTPGHPPANWVGKTAAWVEEKCSLFNESCVESRCCKDPAHACFAKNKEYARCRVTCQPGLDITDSGDWKNWTCKQLGGRTPGVHDPPHAQYLAPWVKDHCSDMSENCAKTKCCKDPTTQCYEKFPGQGQCMYKCLKGHADWSHHRQCANEAKANTSEMCKYDGKTWTCRELGPRTLRPWGWPSLFCLHVMRLKSYEAGLVKEQLKKDGRFQGGIFNCDQFAVYAHDTADGTYLGDGPYGPVRTHWFQSAPVWVSKDHTAANTLLFMNMWEAVRWDLQYQCCDWVVKVDPDAVIIPARMRIALSKKMAWLNYVATCKGTLYGAVEAIQRKSLQRYYDNEPKCRGMPWQPWGEDVWISRCLLSLGVFSAFDAGFVADNLCDGANCANGISSGYHPFKDVNSWMNCYNQAMGNR